jgi:CTP:molybdopterin cytidylyltransferase MocA
MTIKHEQQLPHPNIKIQQTRPERLGEEPAKLVVVLAGGLAAITPSTVDRLVAAVSTAGSVGTVDGAVLIDDDGHRQWLLSAWRRRRRGPPCRRTSLVRRCGGCSAGLSIVEVPEESGESADVDAPGDLDRWS